MKNDKIQKFNEFNPDNHFTKNDEMNLFVDEDIHVKMSEFEHIEEGILRDLKTHGFWKGLKRMGTKVAARVTDYVKNDKKMQAALSNAVKQGGMGVMDDIGVMFAEFDKKIQDANKRAEEAEAKVNDIND